MQEWYHSLMPQVKRVPLTRPTRTPRDPSEVSVQISFRLPFWYREQLAEEANKLDCGMPQFVLEALQRQFPPMRTR